MVIDIIQLVYLRCLCLPISKFKFWSKMMDAWSVRNISRDGFVIPFIQNGISISTEENL